MSRNDDTDFDGDMRRVMRHQYLSSYFWRIAALLCVLLIGLVSVISGPNTRDEADIDTRLGEPATDAEQIRRSAYLARAGNCQSCHTQAGSAPYAGGEGIQTPFGVVYAGNLTPDKKRVWVAGMHRISGVRCITGLQRMGGGCIRRFPMRSTRGSHARIPMPFLRICAACLRWSSLSEIMRCVFLTTRRWHWPCGERCISSRSIIRRCLTNPRNGTGGFISLRV